MSVATGCGGEWCAGPPWDQIDLDAAELQFSRSPLSCPAGATCARTKGPAGSEGPTNGAALYDVGASELLLDRIAWIS